MRLGHNLSQNATKYVVCTLRYSLHGTMASLLHTGYRYGMPYGAPKRESGNKSLLYVELIDLHVSWQQFAEQDGFFFSVKRRK